MKNVFIYEYILHTSFFAIPIRTPYMTYMFDTLVSNLLAPYNEALPGNAILPESHHEAKVLRPQTPITSVAGASMPG